MARQFLGEDWITWELLGDVLARQERGQDAFDAYRRALSAVIDSKVEGLLARATLLRKSLEVLPPGDSATADSAREASFQEDLRKVLALGNGLSDEASQRLRPVLKELAAACAKAGRTQEMDRVVAVSREGSVAKP